MEKVFDIEGLNKKNETLNKNIAMAIQLNEIIDKSKIQGGYVYDGQIAFFINNFEQLAYLRKKLKEHYGNWEDEIYSIDNTVNNIVQVRYQGKGENTKNTKIWFETTVETIPAQFTNSGKCKFVEETNKRYSFVCDKGGMT